MNQEVRILSVTQLNEIIKGVLNKELSNIWVCGEISGLSCSSAGHVYLSLKDGAGVINAVFWKSTASRLNFDLKEGVELLCRGRVDVYPPSGRYQLIIDYAEPRGEGKLQREYRLLYQKLSAEGLFDTSRKQPLPPNIRKIGIITGPGTAALHDFLETLRRRWKGLNVLIAPSRVQGEGACNEVAAQVYNLNRLKEPVDVIVLARGGGSPEDLWTFNEEVVVRAVAASKIPTVSAIGHEVDVTLCDFAADVRALTPTEAAERVSPDSDAAERMLNQYKNRLKTALQGQAALARTRLEGLENRRVFMRPLEYIEFYNQRLDDLHVKLTRNVNQTLVHAGQKLAGAAGVIESLSPLQTLTRGYSVTINQQGNVLKSIQNVSPGDRITTILESGKLTSIVEKTIVPPDNTTTL